jgi:Rieske 2Fe-2S family protein
VWAGFLFVHADPTAAPPLREWLGDLPDLIGGFRPELLVEVAHVQMHVAANWKLYVENHIDMYHLWYLHEQSLAAYDHPKHRWDDCAPHWSFYEPPRAGVTDDAQFVRGFPPIRHVGPEVWGSGAHLVFPNVPFATGAGFFMTYQCRPVGPEHTIIDLRVRAEPGDDHDVPAFLEMVGTVLHGEDGAACEQIQRALRSPAFAVGPLAGALEEPITRFHEHYLAAMGR